MMDYMPDETVRSMIQMGTDAIGKCSIYTEDEFFAALKRAYAAEAKETFPYADNAAIELKAQMRLNEFCLWWPLVYPIIRNYLTFGSET